MNIFLSIKLHCYAITIIIIIIIIIIVIIIISYLCCTYMYVYAVFFSHRQPRLVFSIYNM